MKTAMRGRLPASQGRAGLRPVLSAALLLAAGPALPGGEARAETDAACETDFVVITTEAPACGFALTETGAFTREGRALADPLVASYQHERDGYRPIAAGQVVLFPPSPSGRFRVVQACEGAGTRAMCWSVRILDQETGDLHESHAGHYGPERWQSWSPGEERVVLADGNEGSWRLHIIDPTNGASEEHPPLESEENWIIEPQTLTWTGARSFSVTIRRCARCRAQRREFDF